MIISFGYQNARGVPPAAKVFDVRQLTHRTQSPEFQAKIAEIRHYSEQHPTEVIAIGCQRGTHRSVAIARQVSAALRRSVMHRDQ